MTAVLPDVAIPTVDANAFINGKSVASISGRTFETRSPADGRLLANVAECDAADVDAAVSAARGAFESGVWSRMAPTTRKKALLRFADLLEEHSDELALLDAFDAGKPIIDCESIDLPDTVETIRWFAEAIDKLYDQVSPTGPDALGLVVHEPIGVVGAVLPWNFPLLMLAWKAGPVLAAGNSLVVKPAEQTPLSALRFAQLATEAGIPDGVINVVPGFGETAGAALGLHMDVDMLAFTGSTEVGRHFLRYSADSNLKRVVLECGGKSPQIVMADIAADLDEVIDQMAFAAFWNMGQNCSCGSRMLIHRDVMDLVTEKLATAAGQWKVGHPLDRSSKLGPLIEEQHMNKVLGYVDSGRSEGAEVVLGGDQILRDLGGWYVPPTILRGVTNEMKVAREEIFGPVVSLIPFTSEEEAIRLANDTPYGLASSLYTNDLNVAHRVSRSIRAGLVSINCYSEGDLSSPFGGYKQSGFGGRDKSLQALHQYTESKTIWYSMR
jgi:4-(gamma-glutamylamino)butanal dehydrogenase